MTNVCRQLKKNGLGTRPTLSEEFENRLLGPTNNFLPAFRRPADIPSFTIEPARPSRRVHHFGAEFMHFCKERIHEAE
jgi:hypothetical protein